jgi:hypothetical protein
LRHQSSNAKNAKTAEQRRDERAPHVGRLRRPITRTIEPPEKRNARIPMRCVFWRFGRPRPPRSGGVRRARTFAMFALFVILRGSWTGMQRHTHFSALFALSAFLL